MSKLTVLLLLATSLSLPSSRGRAQPPAARSGPTVMIVVEPNRTRVSGRELRAAVTRQLALVAVPVSFPTATESSAWVAISPAPDGKIAMRVRRTTGRGASRVERAPEDHALEWLLENVRWLLEASAPPAVSAHPRMARSEDLDENIRRQLNGQAPAVDRALTSVEDLDRDLARDAARGAGGADALARPTP